MAKATTNKKPSSVKSRKAVVEVNCDPQTPAETRMPQLAELYARLANDLVANGQRAVVRTLHRAIWTETDHRNSPDAPPCPLQGDDLATRCAAANRVLEDAGIVVAGGPLTEVEVRGLIDLFGTRQLKSLAPYSPAKSSTEKLLLW